MYAWKKSIISLDLLRQAITIGVRTRILAPAAAPCAWNSVRWLHCAWASNRPSMWMWGHQRTRSIHADTWRLRKLSSEQLYTLLWLKYDSTNWWFTFDSCRYWAIRGTSDTRVSLWEIVITIGHYLKYFVWACQVLKWALQVLEFFVHWSQVFYLRSFGIKQKAGSIKHCFQLR